MWLVNKLRAGWRWLSSHWRHDLKVVDLVGEEIPAVIPSKKLICMLDEGQPWAAAMVCPCGCGDAIELMLLEGVSPRWDLSVDRGLPTLRPSVWRNVGCRSHFWVKRGRIDWVSRAG